MLRRLTAARGLPEMDHWSIRRGSLDACRDLPSRLVWADDRNSLAILVDDDPPGGPTFVVLYDEVAQFDLRYASHDIVVTPLDDLPDTTIHHLLVDQIWPRILGHAGHLVLHAAGVSTDRGAVLFLGESGRGKSTLGASLHQRGHGLLGDDAVIVSSDAGAPRCRAVYRSLRLFPDSIATLFDPHVLRSEVADYTDKENVHLAVPDRGEPEAPVRALFFLAPPDGCGEVAVTPLSPGDACMSLVEHSFWLDPTDKARTAGRLQAAGALADRVPAYSLAYPRAFASLDAVHDAIFTALA